MTASNSDLWKTIKSNPRKQFKKGCKFVGFDFLQAGINKNYKTWYNINIFKKAYIGNGTIFSIIL